MRCLTLFPQDPPTGLWLGTSHSRIEVLAVVEFAGISGWCCNVARAPRSEAPTQAGPNPILGVVLGQRRQSLTAMASGRNFLPARDRAEVHASLYLYTRPSRFAGAAFCWCVLAGTRPKVRTGHYEVGRPRSA